MAIVNLKATDLLICPKITKRQLKKNITYPHRHTDFYEIEFFISGEGTGTINGKEITLHKGACFLMTPLDIHSYVTRDKKPYIYNINFTEQMLLKEYQNILFNTRMRYVHFEDTKTIQNLLELMLNESQTNNHFTINNMTAYLNLIIAHFINTAKIEDISSKTASIINDVVKYIRIHISENLTLSGIAKKFNVSSQYLSTLFSRQLGVGFKHYITVLRLDLAKNLLAQTDINVINISYETGFSSIGTFLRSFKKNCGMTPSEYRQKHSANFTDSSRK